MHLHSQCKGGKIHLKGEWCIVFRLLASLWGFLSDIFSDFLSDIFSDFLSDIFSDFLSDIFSDFLSDIFSYFLSDIFSYFLSDFYVTDFLILIFLTGFLDKYLSFWGFFEILMSLCDWIFL